VSGDEIGHRIPRLPLLLNTDEPITVTYNSTLPDRVTPTPYPASTTLQMEFGSVIWPGVVIGAVATVTADVAMVNAIIAAGTSHYRTRATYGGTPSFSNKGPVIVDA